MKVDVMQRVATAAQTAALAYPEGVRPMVRDMLITGGVTASINTGRMDLSGWSFTSYQELVLALGYVRQGKFPLTDERIGVKPIKECFTNAYHAVMEHPNRYWYTEGYANYSLLAVNHAWLTEKRTGRIVDPTWAGLDRPDDSVPVYAGIRFSLEMLIKRTMQTGYTSILTEDWRLNGAAIRYGFTMRNGIAVNGRTND